MIIKFVSKFLTIKFVSKAPIMKMSAIEEIEPIEVQALGRQATLGEIAEINNNYKTGHGATTNTKQEVVFGEPI